MSIISFRRQHRYRIGVLALIGVILLYWLITINQANNSGDSERLPVQWRDQRALAVVRKGLEMKNNQFYLDGKDLRILSGALHYFRVVPEYWMDRLMRLKAAGLNTVETYVPWNLHEEVRGEFNFEGILDIRRFVAIAEKLGLLVIVRPGPFICSEWEFGGLPSWLLHDRQMDVRTTYEPFMQAARSYLRVLIREIEDMQYQYGGPIIAMQVENEYGSYHNDVNYMEQMKDVMVQGGVVELLFTSDNKNGIEPGRIPGVFMTVNFKNSKQGAEMFDMLREKQPSLPMMVMEFWTGWFDHWGENHHTWSLEEYSQALEYILHEGSSVNLYMFHGGTNFGFLNGANAPYVPTITSYDYDAPLSEHGEITEKYKMTRRLFGPLNTRFELPPIPEPLPKKAYGTVKITQILPWTKILNLVEPISSPEVLSMETLDINHHGGQSFGFIVYSKSNMNSFKLNKNLEITGYVRDRAQILVDGQQVSVVDWKTKDPKVDLPDTGRTLDIVVENLGRVNYASKGSGEFNNQRKGLLEPVLLAGSPLTGWEIYPLEFKTAFIDKAMNKGEWESYKVPSGTSPMLFRATLTIDEEPKDTFVKMQGWKKGVVFVNNFNLGRYWDIGPQKTLYLPAPLLRRGPNEIVIFELHESQASIEFVASPELA